MFINKIFSIFCKHEWKFLIKKNLFEEERIIKKFAYCYFCKKCGKIKIFPNPHWTDDRLMHFAFYCKNLIKKK